MNKFDKDTFFTNVIGSGTEPLPWPDLEVPDYKLVKYKDWEVKDYSIPLARGYFRGLQPIFKKNYQLWRKDTIWMSVTPMELESQAPAVANAHGDVILMGLGMGMALYNMVKKPEVYEVVVIEKDPDVIEIFQRMTEGAKWEGYEKVRFIVADALNFIPTWNVDYVAADIWADLGSMALRSDAQLIAKNTKTPLLSIWGIELDIISYFSDREVDPDNPTLNDYLDYIEATGLPLIEQDNNLYPDMITKAGWNVLMY